MSDQATIDIPVEATPETTPETTPVKRGFFRRLFDVTFFLLIWLFSSPTKTLDYLAQTSSSVIVELLPNSLSPLLLGTLTFPFHVYMVYKPVLRSRKTDGGEGYYRRRFVRFLSVAAIFQSIALPLVGFLLSFLTGEKFTIRHYRFYQSTFTALIPVSLAAQWFLVLMNDKQLGTWRIIPAIISFLTTIILAFAFMKRVPSYGVNYKWRALNILHHVAVMVIVVLFACLLTFVMVVVAMPD